MWFDFFTDSFQWTGVYIQGKKREDFLIFQNISFCILNTFMEYGLLIHINLENLKKLLLPVFLEP